MIRIFLKLVVLLACLYQPFAAYASETKIMIIGDSLSAGYGLKQDQDWVNLLQNKYAEEKKSILLINMSVSGQTTDNALLNIDAQLKAHKPSHVLIELGGNDGIRGFPIKLIRSHLTQLVEKSKNSGAQVAIMEIQIPPNLGPRYTKMFTGNYQKVAQATGAHLMDYFMVPVAVDKSLMQNDNLHPNEKAQPIIRDFMAEQFNQWLN
ncbi:arylesterase [Pseudoalteromonas luteoviolacea]|uniref:Arylesterase n=1 Tax=Pseudoalteromonas luteoviolacea TaxID=43657 RepID=A0A1C0TRG0_9GAMM|nr:arylesterase [Pseudoalteromonas luteoviolacea]MBQ4811644.1 arylesterase [Pseudoalteromonas luteoviolacea]OCQ21383.1 arylesterase [Pseudoalteromonas luteoviolacea]